MGQRCCLEAGPAGGYVGGMRLRNRLLLGAATVALATVFPTLVVYAYFIVLMGYDVIHPTPR